MAASRPLRYRIHAALYDRVVQRGNPVMVPLREFAAGSASGRVLEIGSGTGLNLAHYRWDAVDSLDMAEPDPYMQQGAWGRVVGLSPEVRSRVSLCDAAAESLPFPAATFDTVVSTLVLCTVSDLDRAIGEIHRVLKPDGQLRLVEHVGADGVAATVQRLVQPPYGWFAADCQLSRHTEAAVRDAGFRLEVVQRFSLGGPLFPGFAGVATKD